MRVVFMGTSAFAAPALAALHATSGVTIPAVYTQPPRKAGRGHKLKASDVQQMAGSLGLDVRTPSSLKPDGEAEALAALRPDLVLVASYGLLLPQRILDIPAHGCVNIHASILPRWRGASPIQQAILAGDKESGVDFFRMERGLDTGPILRRQTTAIGPDDTGGSLHDRLAAIGAGLVPEFIACLEAGKLTPQAQPVDGAIYAPKIDKADSIVDWSHDAASIERMIRAFDPWPGAWTELGDERLRLLSGEVADGAGAPGQVIDTPLTIACGSGALRITRLQRAGRKPLRAQELLRGFDIPPGSILGQA